jgi:hypothetical protein
MYTDERIHTYCHNASIQNNNSIRLKDTKANIDNNHINTQSYIQNQLNDEIKYNSINILTSYWDSIFESTKVVNRYWSRLFSIINSRSSMA